MPYKLLNLQLFAEEGGSMDAGTGEVASLTGENSVSEGVATEGSEEQVAPVDGNQTPQEETFESLIKGKYKQDYDNAVKKAIQNRFKNQRDLQSQIDSIDPIVKMAAQKWGVNPGDDGRISIKDLYDAMSNDNSMYEKEAFERGMSVEDLKTIKNLERENASLRQQNVRTAEQKAWDALTQEGEELKQTYPNFDLDMEMQNPDFGRLLATMQKSGFPNAVRTAYEAVHREEIMGGAMQYAVAETERKIANSIKSGTRRPSENGTSQQATAQLGTIDPSKLTLAQIEEIKKRAERGERVIL